MAEVYDAIIIGGGPAGLSAALNLGRARARVLVVDADRPRNAATLNSHGFLTRDGVPPHELRRLAREEVAAYPNVEIHIRARVTGITPVSNADTSSRSARSAPDSSEAEGAQRDEAHPGDARFVVGLAGKKLPEEALTRSILVATGLKETLPDVPGILSFYGTTLFSCAACDAWELQDKRLGLFGETGDLASRARLIARWTDELTVFTNGADVVSEADEAVLTSEGIRVDRRRIAALEGDKTTISGVRVDDGETVPVDGGFVRPHWDPVVDFLAALDPEFDEDGHLVADRAGRTSVPGLYGAGDVVSPGPQQLIVAAGQGARVAAVLIHDLVGVVTAH